MKKSFSAKHIIIAAVIVIVVAAAAFTAVRLPVYMHVKAPFNHIVNGYKDGDSQEILEALPDAVIEKIGLEQDDYDEIDDAIDEISDNVLSRYLNDDDYDVKVKILGYKKINAEQRNSLEELYQSLGVDMDITKAYYTDFKLKVTSDEDDLSFTYGVTVGKVDGKWCIIGADMITNTVLIPSVKNYADKSNLKTANSNAKMAYNAVAEYVADKETQGIGLDGAMEEIGGVIDCRGERPSNEAQALVYDALSYDGDDAGIVYVFTAYVNDSYTFVVQWRSSDDSDVIGQYPEAITTGDDDVTWGVFHGYNDDDYDY